MNTSSPENLCPLDASEGRARELPARLWFRIAENGGCIPVDRCNAGRTVTRRRGCRGVAASCGGAR